MKAINVTKIMKAIEAQKDAQNGLDYAVKYGRKKSTIDELTAIRDTKCEAASKLLAVLSDAIKEAEGRASARCITATDIIDELTAVERGLRIPKKSTVGVSVVVDANAQDFPNAYKYTPTSTWFRAEYTSTGWKVTDIYRGETARYNAKYRIKLTDEAKTRIIENYEYGFRNI